MSYQIKLEAFEGPLDLLLHLIKKNEVNIYDIPISLITHQYLEYIELMKEFNLEIAGEFLLMAATLTYIKSRMLLPQEEKAGVDELEEDDPRAELIRKLLEYKSFKEVADELGKREEIWRDIFYQGHEPAPAAAADVTEEDKEELMIEVGIFELIDAFRDVLDRLPDKKTLDIIPEELTVRGRMTAIIERLETEGINGLTLYELLDNDSTKRSIVVTFLALLELAKMRVIRLLQVEDRETIRVFKAESEEKAEGI
ncbi:MAG: segregation/condensation protein A [Nitrospirae bacterium]|nr:segregation/condensation protein A [Nitrospirota bacterium]